MKWSYECSAASAQLHVDKITRTGGPGKAVPRRLHLSPDVFEVVEPRLALQPLGCAHSAFGEAAARFGIVAEIDSVGRGLHYQFMHSDDLAFAEGSNFDFHTGSTLQNVLHGRCRAR